MEEKIVYTTPQVEMLRLDFDTVVLQGSFTGENMNPVDE